MGDGPEEDAGYRSIDTMLAKGNAVGAFAGWRRRGT
jgi:hypothetical protein